MLKPFRLLTTICILFVPLLFGIGTTSAQTSASERQPITVDNASQIRQLPTLVEQGSGMSQVGASLALSPDGTHLAAGNIVGDIIVWDVAQNRKVLAIQSPHYVSHLAYSLDGKLLASGSRDPWNDGQNTVFLFDAASGKELLHLDYTSAIRDLWFSHDGEQLVTLSDFRDSPSDYSLRFWNTGTGAELTDLRVNGDNAGFDAAVLNSDEIQLAVGSGNSVSLLGASDHTQLGQFIYERPAPSDSSVMPGWWEAFFTNGEMGFNVADDGAKITDVYLLTSTVETSDRASDSITNGQFTHDFIGITCQLAGQFTSSTAATGTACSNAAPWTAHPSLARVAKIAYGADESVIAVGYNDGTIQLWDTQTGQIANTMTAGDRFSDQVNGLAFNSDRTVLASISSDGKLRLWDAATGTMLADLAGYVQASAVAFSADGTLLATTGSPDSGNDAVRLWAVPTTP